MRPPEEERAWEVVRRAYEERTPQPRHARSRVLIPALVVLAAAIAAAVLSPPGRAVFERVRQAVGVEHADPALFSLPAPGRLLVVSTDGGGVWLVRDNGFKRRLGAVRGRAVVAAWALRRGDDPQPPARPRRGRSRALVAHARAARRCRAGRAR